MSIGKIKKRVKLKKDSRTKNLWKINVYDMELNMQSKLIYTILDQVFTLVAFDHKEVEVISLKFLVASDIIRLPIINIIGGIYFDIDTKINGKIENLNSKYGFNFNTQYCKENHSIQNFSNFFAKSNNNNEFFNQVMFEYIQEIFNIVRKQENITCTSPSTAIYNSLISECKKKKVPENKFIQILLDYSNNLPPTVILDNDRKCSSRTVNYNNQEQLKELGLDKKDYMDDQVEELLSKIQPISITSIQNQNNL